MWEVVIGGLYKIEAKTQEEAKSKAVAQFEEEIAKAIADGHSSSFLSHLNKGVYYINVKGLIISVSSKELGDASALRAAILGEVRQEKR
jgi:hypothetical protein